MPHRVEVPEGFSLLCVVHLYSDLKRNEKYCDAVGLGFIVISVVYRRTCLCTCSYTHLHISGCTHLHKKGVHTSTHAPIHMLETHVCVIIIIINIMLKHMSVQMPIHMSTRTSLHMHSHTSAYASMHISAPTSMHVSALHVLPPGQWQD